MKLRRLVPPTLLSLLIVFACQSHSFAASADWTGATSGDWQVGANWVQGAAPNGATDVATISSGFTTITNASGLLNTLSWTLDNSSIALGGTMTISSGLNIGGGSIVTGQTFNLNNKSLGVGTNVTVGDHGTLVNDFVGSSTAATINGNLTVNGSNATDRGRVNLNSGGSNAVYVTTVTGDVTLNGGAVNLAASTTTGSTRLQVNGNFTMQNGAAITGMASSNNVFILNGATNSIDSTSTVGTGTSLNLFGNQNQTLTTAVDLDGLQVRTGGSNGTTYTRTVTMSSAAHQVGSLLIGSGNTGANLNFVMGSDIAVKAGGTVSSVGSAANATIGWDLNGHTFDNSANTGNFNLAGNTGATVWNFTSSSGTGVLKANNVQFTNTAWTYNVGPNVIIHSSGTSGNIFEATTHFDSTAKIIYTATQSGSFIAANTVIPYLQVGDASTTTVLKISSSASYPALTMSGNIVLMNSSTFQMNGKEVRMTGGASLTGTGTVQSTAATVTNSVTFLSGSTGGLIPGDDGTVSLMTLNCDMTLASTSLSLFDVFSGVSYDKIVATASSNEDWNFAGTLRVKFTGTGYTDGEQFQLFDLYDNKLTATNFNAVEVLGLDPGWSGSFDAATGKLTISSVPEPHSMALLILGVVAVAGSTRLRGRRVEI